MNVPRNLFHFTLANILTFVVFWLVQINLSWLAFSLTQSSLLLGVLGFIINIPMILLIPIAGVYSDKFSRKHIIVFSQFLYLVPNVAFFFLSRHNAITYNNMLLVGLLYGVLFSVAKPATDSIVYDLVTSEQELKWGVSLYSATRQIALLFTPWLSAYVLRVQHLPGIFLTCGIANLLSTAFFCAIRPARHSELNPDPQEAFWPSLRNGFFYVVRHPTLLFYILLVSMALALIISLQFQFPALIKAAYGGAHEELYYFYFFGALGGLAGAILVLRASYGATALRPTLFASLLGQALCLVALGFARNRAEFCAIVFLIEALGMIVTIVGTIAIQQTTANETRGRVMSLLAMSRIGCIPLASLVIGIAAQLLGVAMGMVVCGCTYVLAISLYYFRTKNTAKTL